MAGPNGVPAHAALAAVRRRSPAAKLGPMGDAMLLDRILPGFDATRIEHRVVAGGPDEVYRIVREVDFLRAWRESPVVRVLFAARATGERLVALVRRAAVEAPPDPGSLRLADLTAHGEWVLLAEDPLREIAFGAVGRFWAGETAWAVVDAAEFAALDRPGLGKIACSVSLRPYGADRTLVSYEARTMATDPRSRRAFLRYWRVVSPFVGVVMRSMLSVVERDAMSGSRAPRAGGAR
jgi:hypothetical protein